MFIHRGLVTGWVSDGGNLAEFFNQGLDLTAVLLTKVKVQNTYLNFYHIVQTLKSVCIYIDKVLIQCSVCHLNLILVFKLSEKLNIQSTNMLRQDGKEEGGMRLPTDLPIVA